MTPNNYSVNALLQRGAIASEEPEDGVSLSLETLLKVAGESKVITPELLKNLIESEEYGGVSSAEREQFAKVFASVLESNVNDPLVMSAAYSFLVLELEAIADDKGLSMSEVLTASKRAEEIRHALEEFKRKALT